ncbi:unnamed protein product [Didymodactylos carnosus]|uniref:NAD(P)(+)--arginine ADP-ribosyltransferase n=1 Tax=Didymodactylos carnosus TaxID=1234261 RepID=A0A8S2RFA8_9BILA|nr:unnamed protein product [Didymodactylos carnosus]CAF4163723.1 unnamed protein product [Didymodactylos carnosus]
MRTNTVEYTRAETPYFKLNLQDMSKNCETFTLVWLDTNVKKERDNNDMQKKLRAIISFLIIFEDFDQCQTYINKHDKSKENKLVLIVSGTYGLQIIEYVHALQSVKAIYVYCMDKIKHEQWAQKYEKIKAVVTTSSELIERIRDDQVVREQIEVSTMPIAIFNEKTHTNVDSENGNFMWLQLLIEVLLRMDQKENEQEELLQICEKTHADDQDQLQNIDEFRKFYSSNTALRWYTRQSCFYRMLNQALRIKDIDMLFAFRFFIKDLHTNLTEMHKEQSQSPITQVYRCQLISNDELDKIRSSLNQYVSMNSFLSTSFNQQSALSFVSSTASTDQLRRVLFEINIDPTINTKPYADISKKSYFKNEREVLFFLGSIFQIIDVRDDNGQVIIVLNLCSEQNHKFKELFEHLKSKIGEKTDLASFGSLLFQISDYERSEKYYNRLLMTLEHNEYSSRASCYQGLGVIAKRQGLYDIAIKHNEESLRLNLLLPNNYKNTAANYQSLAVAYEGKEDYVNALKHFNNAVDMLTLFNNYMALDVYCIFSKLSKCVICKLIFTQKILVKTIQT